MRELFTRNSFFLSLAMLAILLIVGRKESLAQVDQEKNLQYVHIQQGMQDVFGCSFQISPEGRYKSIHGSPFLNDEWCNGAIKLKGDVDYFPFRMRYNVYGNQMQFIHEKDTFSIGNPLMVDTIQLDGRYFVYLPFHLGENFNMAWFEVITRGWPRLLIRHQARLEAGSEPVTPYHCQNDYDRFVRNSISYLLVEGLDEPIEIPGRQKEFERLDFLAKYRGYILDEKIRVRQSDDLIRLFTHIEESSSVL